MKFLTNFFSTTLIDRTIYFSTKAIYGYIYLRDVLREFNV